MVVGLGLAVCWVVSALAVASCWFEVGSFYMAGGCGVGSGGCEKSLVVGIETKLRIFPSFLLEEGFMPVLLI
jgi:hypothetical protein